MAVVRIVVSGSREWCNRSLVTEMVVRDFALEGEELASAVEWLLAEQYERTEAALRWAYENASKTHEDAEIVLVHGGAAGADQTCGAIWRAQGLPVQIEETHWKSEGKDAGFIRNLRMLSLENVAVVLAFHTDRSPGTEHCVSNAVAQGLPVWLWAQRDYQPKSSVRLTAENILRFYPQLGKGHHTYYMAARKSPSPAKPKEGAQQALPIEISEPRTYYDAKTGHVRCGECNAVQRKAKVPANA